MFQTATPSTSTNVIMLLFPHFHQTTQSVKPKLKICSRTSKLTQLSLRVGKVKKKRTTGKLTFIIAGNRLDPSN